MRPELAPVKPRFISRSTGDALILEESVVEAIRHFHQGVIEIAGPVGAGKTIALRHLAAVIPKSLNARFFDGNVADHEVPEDAASIIEVCDTAEPLPGRIARFDLAPWGSDECIEYTLARHPNHCSSVVGRLLKFPDRDLLEGCPELCSLVLDRMVADETLTSVAAVLEAEIAELTDGRILLLASTLKQLTSAGPLDLLQQNSSLPIRLQRLLQHRSVRVIAFGKALSEQLNTGLTCGVQVLNHTDLFNRSRLIDLICPFITPNGMHNIRKALRNTEEDEIHPLLAMIMFRLDKAWRPDIKVRPRLRRADLSGANWPEADLRRFNLAQANLSNACLGNALLMHADLEGANLSGASLHGARMRNVLANKANLKNTDLREVGARGGHFGDADLTNANGNHGIFHSANFFAADLTDASFRNSTLTEACLVGSILSGTDFLNADLTSVCLMNVDLRDTILDGAILEDADLTSCNLESVQLRAARFFGARLAGVILTGTVMPNADFRHANLCGAYLANVDWQGADLRRANFLGATFHMGSSRSGLVNSDIASEGSRTGFYSNDYDDHLYRAPEEIRSANLCNCDLRGANLKGVDFYRVDLRGARFDAHHRGQLVETGALLDDR